MIYQTKTNQLKLKKMTTTKITKRELHLQLSEIENTSDAFKFALNLMTSLKNNIITHNEYDMFSGDLYWVCLKNNIKTTSEGISLF